MLDIYEEKEDNYYEVELKELLVHGICVSNLAYLLGKELGYSEEDAYDLAVAGLLHDIGKLRLSNYIYEKNANPLQIDELRYVRIHSTLGYMILREYDYSEKILNGILYHHENFDGSGYPANLVGEDIPMEARILRVCDVYSALISNRPYRKAFDAETAMELMIDEVKNYDMKVFLAFQRVVNSKALWEKIGCFVEQPLDE
ncbi:MAG: HD domain-containing protein [Lachnospiraceae bacterium]|nr:HD domain-containing protein [Lachnospiraceae bacterium]MEE1341675.1 HD domain-containing protein [Lachnospiraceae bacterium]